MARRKPHISDMQRRVLTCSAVIVAVGLVAPNRGPSVRDMFVATTEAAEATEGAICLMPDDRERPAEAGRPDGEQLAIPKRSDAEGGDLPPVRMVVDPYPSFNGVVVDSTNDLVMMSDTNRKSLLLYDRTAGSALPKDAASPRQTIMGPDTGVGFVA